MISIHTSSSDQIWQKASQFLINWLKLYHNIGQKTLLLLSGGSAMKLYPALAEFIKSSDSDFGFLAIGQVDERFKPENPKFETRNSNKISNINSQIIAKTGLWEVCKKKNIPYYLVSQEGTLEDAADKYNRQIEELFKDYTYKIGVLGIGEDCHTAGLLPGYKNAWDKKQFALGYENKGRFPSRITLTPMALEQLDQAVVVAAGEKKRWAIDNATKDGNLSSPDKYPAAILRKIKKADLFIDIQLEKYKLNN